jgi:hypothetical protein
MERNPTASEWIMTRLLTAAYAVGLILAGYFAWARLIEPVIVGAVTQITAPSYVLLTPPMSRMEGMGHGQ